MTGIDKTLYPHGKKKLGPNQRYICGICGDPQCGYSRDA